MTLKEKLFDAVFDGMYEFKKANILPRLVDIADEFAIGFAAWCIKKRVDFFDDTDIGETYTIDGFVSRYKMEELLEIYKKEKGL